MKASLKNFVTLLKRAFGRWQSDNAMRLAASLSYYTAFSLAPLLLAAISIGGLIFGEEAASGRIFQELKGTLGPSVAASIQELVVAARKPSEGILGMILAFALILFGASGVFGELKDALNIIWKQQPKAGSGIWTWVRGRFLSVGMVLGVCFLLLISLVVNTSLGAASDWVGSLFGASPIVLQIFATLISLVFVILLFALLFKFLPDTKIAWSDVWIGSVVTAILFILGKSGLEIYLSKAAVASSYGAAGALALVLVWVYYSAQIFLLGAEFTAVYAEKAGSRPDLKRVTQETLSPQAAPQAFIPHPIPARPAPPPRGHGEIPVTGLERLAKVLAVEKPDKLKPSQHLARLAGAGLVLSAARMLERWKARRGPTSPRL